MVPFPATSHINIYIISKLSNQQPYVQLKKNKTIQYQKWWINEGKKVSLLISFAKKNIHIKLLIMLLFRVLWKKTTLNTGIKIYLLPLHKVMYKRKTHFFKRSITWYLHWKTITSKKLFKACQSILKRINKMHLKPG